MELTVLGLPATDPQFKRFSVTGSSEVPELVQGTLRDPNLEVGTEPQPLLDFGAVEGGLEVLRSLPAGDDECQFLIHLPVGAVE